MKPRTSKFVINPGAAPGGTWEVEAGQYELESGYFNFYSSSSTEAHVVFTIKADRVGIIEMQKATESDS